MDALATTGTAPKPFVFVLMPLDPKFNDIYKFGIQGAASDAGAYAERVTDQIFNEGILERIYNQISKADVIVADMSERNPNVFYEVGYAHALGKIVILLTQRVEDIPFDLKNFPHIVYAGKIDELRKDLAPRISWAIQQASRSKKGVIERFSLRRGASAISVSSARVAPPTFVLDLTAGEFVGLDLQVRNDGVETTEPVSHIYLFAAGIGILRPVRYQAGHYPNAADGSTTAVTTWFADGPTVSALPSFEANPADAPDGLTMQFRLDATLPALPPGAVEEIGLVFAEGGGKQSYDELFRLRLNSPSAFHDFSFRLKGTISPAPPKGKK